jgi:hypothetical protein
MANPAYARFAHVGARRVVLDRGDQHPAAARRPVPCPTPASDFPADGHAKTAAGTVAKRSRVCFGGPNL